MSTKNIARTVIEGGRTDRNTHERRQSNRIQRKEVRTITRSLSRLVDQESYTLPDRPRIEKEHADKLEAAMSWLIHHGLGKTPPEIEALLLTRFNTKTIAGRHIVFEHLLLKLKPVSRPSKHKKEDVFFLRKVTTRKYFAEERGFPRKHIFYRLGLERLFEVRHRSRVAKWSVGYNDITHRRNFYWFLPENGFRLQRLGWDGLPL